MEPNPPTNSIPQTPQHSQGNASVSPKVMHLSMTSWVRTILWGVLAGIVLSVVITAVIVIAPYNRIVIFPQVRSSIVQLASVRLKDPGFVMVYLKTDTGWLLVGASGYLVQGYYSRMVIPTSLDAVQNDVGRIIAVRILKNSGTVELDEVQEIPVRTLFGGVYQKKVTFLYPNRKFRQWLLYFLDDPLGVIGDYLIP